MKTLLHQERTDGTIVTVTAYADGRFNLHVRKRWGAKGTSIKHVASKDISRQEVLAMGLSKELADAEAALANWDAC